MGAGREVPLFYLLGTTQPSPKSSVFHAVRATGGGGGGMGVHVLRSEAEKSIVTCFLKTVEVFNLKAQIGLHENCAGDATSTVPGTLSRLFSFGWMDEWMDGWMGFDNFFFPISNLYHFPTL